MSNMVFLHPRLVNKPFLFSLSVSPQLVELERHLDAAGEKPITDNDELVRAVRAILDANGFADAPIERVENNRLNLGPVIGTIAVGLLRGVCFSLPFPPMLEIHFLAFHV